MKILPITKVGKWSVVLLAGSFLLFIFTSVVIVGLFHQEGGNTFSDNLYISIPMFGAFGLVIAAFIAGIVSVWKYKERALLIYVPIILGLIASVFIVGESIASH